MKSMYIISRNAEYLKYCMKYLQLKIFKIHVPKTFGTRKRYITRSLSSELLLALCCEDRCTIVLTILSVAVFIAAKWTATIGMVSLVFTILLLNFYNNTYRYPLLSC